MPINVLDASFRSFTKTVLPELERRGIAAIGMKSLGGGAQLINLAGIAAEDCLRFAFSQSIATLVSGMESIELVDQNVRLARGFEPMSRAEQETLIERTRSVAGDGRYELYKTSQLYDSSVHRDQHFFPRLPGDETKGRV